MQQTENKTKQDRINSMKECQQITHDYTDKEIEKIAEKGFKPASDEHIIKIGEIFKINYESFFNRLLASKNREKMKFEIDGNDISRCRVCNSDTIAYSSGSFTCSNHHCFGYMGEGECVRMENEQMTEEEVKDLAEPLTQMDYFLKECVKKKWSLSHDDIQIALSGKFSTLRGDRIKIGDTVEFRLDVYDNIRCPVCMTDHTSIKGKTFTCSDNHQFADMNDGVCVRIGDRKR